MNVKKLKRRTRVLLNDGSLAEVLDILKDGESVRVRYVHAMGEPEMVGARVVIPAAQVIGLHLGVDTAWLT